MRARVERRVPSTTSSCGTSSLRGVTPEDAQRLLIQGFFYEMLSALPDQLAELVERDVATVLASVAEVVAA